MESESKRSSEPDGQSRRFHSAVKNVNNIACSKKRGCASERNFLTFANTK